MAAHSSILAWRIPMDRGAWRATVHRVTQSRTHEQLSTAQHSMRYRCTRGHLPLNLSLPANLRAYGSPHITLG